jgi:hypothetical protein
MLLLAFFLVIAASLTIWAALGLRQHASIPAPKNRAESQLGAPVVVPRPTNDDVRGARVKVAHRKGAGEDAFERFLRSDKPREDSDF